MGLKAQTRFVRLGNKCLYPLRHLAGPVFPFLCVSFVRLTDSAPVGEPLLVSIRMTCLYLALSFWVTSDNPPSSTVLDLPQLSVGLQEEQLSPGLAVTLLWGGSFPSTCCLLLAEWPPGFAFALEQSSQQVQVTGTASVWKLLLLLLACPEEDRRLCGRRIPWLQLILLSPAHCSIYGGRWPSVVETNQLEACVFACLHSGSCHCPLSVMEGNLPATFCIWEVYFLIGPLS